MKLKEIIKESFVKKIDASLKKANDELEAAVKAKKPESVILDLKRKLKKVQNASLDSFI